MKVCQVKRQDVRRPWCETGAPNQSGGALSRWRGGQGPGESPPGSTGKIHRKYIGSLNLTHLLANLTEC